MTRAFTKQEKAYMLAYRKASGKPVAGKYSIKQLPEYNAWAEENDKPLIVIDDEGDEEEQREEDDVEVEGAAIQPKRKRGRPPASAGKPGRPPKSNNQEVRPRAQEPLEDLEKRIELEEKLAEVRSKRAAAELKIAAAAERAAAAKLTEAKAKVIAACAAEDKNAPPSAAADDIYEDA